MYKTFYPLSREGTYISQAGAAAAEAKTTEYQLPATTDLNTAPSRASLPQEIEHQLMVTMPCL
jgi:hypothetical protein